MKMLITYTTRLRELTAEFDRQSDLLEALSKLDSQDDYDEHDAKRITECEEKLDKLRLDIATEVAMCFNAHPVVLRILDDHRGTDIGQYAGIEKKAILAAVKNGILIKQETYRYPRAKDEYVRNPRYPLVVE